jgi:DNA-3-methyladenine glycosylase
MKSFIPLARSFYKPGARLVAPRLLGHFLLRREPEGWCGGAIVEVEAYVRGDQAAHSFGGLTARNRIMWGPPGYGYVYFIYGNHHCVNAVCRTREAVLIRAIEPLFGIEAMEARRTAASPVLLTNGPGKLCQAMGIGRDLDGVDLCDPHSPLIIARNPARRRFLAKSGPVAITRRIGITKAAELELRFLLANCAYVSRRVSTR